MNYTPLVLPVPATWGIRQFFLGSNMCFVCIIGKGII